MLSAYPYPQRLAQGFDDEGGYRDWLAECMERFGGWDTDIEVRSDSGDSRADIIGEHDTWGKVGIECKYKNKITPRNWARAYEQIQRYKQESFEGDDIENWAISTGQRFGIVDVSQDERFETREERDVSSWREFMNTLDVGVIRAHTEFEIIFNHNTPMVKIPIAEIQYPDGELIPPVNRYEDCVTEEAIERLTATEESKTLSDF